MKPVDPLKPQETKILVVDDEEEWLDLIALTLSTRSYQVATAVDGARAIERLVREKFQLVISDVMMPHLDGLQLLDAAKKIHPDVECILMTGFATVEMGVESIKRGAYDFMQKPFRQEEMLARVEKALEKRELRALLGIYQASRAAFSALQLDALLPLIVRLSVQVMGADDSSIMLMQSDGRLDLVTAEGLPGPDRRSSRLFLGERVAGRIAQWREPVIINGPLTLDPRFRDIESLRDIRSALVCPLLVEEELLGILNVNRTLREELFTAEDLRHVTIFASLVSQAIYNAKLYRDLESEAYRNRTMGIQLLQSGKLAGLGQMAAGLAHELNNPLTGILGLSQILLKNEDLPDPSRQDLEAIVSQAKRCRNIIQGMLQFSRVEAPQRAPVDVGSLLSGVSDLVRADMHAGGSSIVIDVAQDLPPVSGDAGQLEQVFVNLAINARQAMEGRQGGRLRISGRRLDDAVELRFEDNGCGIAPEHLPRIFDPFFTSKSAGRGTGLGLSIVHSIVRDHGGSIAVESQEGKGSVFTIRLPTAQAFAACDAEA